jgi:hypothetical protein
MMRMSKTTNKITYRYQGMRNSGCKILGIASDLIPRNVSPRIETDTAWKNKAIFFAISMVSGDWISF